MAALNHLALAAVAKYDTLKTLANANIQLIEIIRKLTPENEKLLLIIDWLAQLLGRNVKPKGMDRPGTMVVTA